MLDGTVTKGLHCLCVIVGLCPSCKVEVPSFTTVGEAGSKFKRAV